MIYFPSILGITVPMLAEQYDIALAVVAHSRRDVARNRPSETPDGELQFFLGVLEWIHIRRLQHRSQCRWLLPSWRLAQKCLKPIRRRFTWLVSHACCPL